MSYATGYLVLESGECFPGLLQGAFNRAGEVVFNTSHSGYEEMATDPSYYSQILVLTAPQQGNYGQDGSVSESRQPWIEGFVCVEMQTSIRDSGWSNYLAKNKIPVLQGIETRKLVRHLRDSGTVWGAIVEAQNVDQAKDAAKKLIDVKKRQDLDWVHAVSVDAVQRLPGATRSGPKVAVLDMGCKTNSLRELQKRCSEVVVFPSRATAQAIRAENPNGIFVSNGPGDPENVQGTVETLKDLLGWRFIFGICMGHQVLARALGAKTYRLKFGHRGSNHPIKDSILNLIYMTSQNHGYAVDAKTLPASTQVTHVNLNDQTVAGLLDLEKKVFGVQFHPESHPGPNDALGLFDYFVRQIQ